MSNILHPWTKDKIKILTNLWGDGRHSTRQIAERLGPGFTRNSVIGKAHRLNLSCQPSPINIRKKATYEYEPVQEEMAVDDFINRHDLRSKSK